MVLGHDINNGQRTQDVRISQDISFDSMLLSNSTLEGLQKCGYLKPSPIQLLGIPMGKCGFDLLLEAKSGTGKTVVFTVIALEKVDITKEVQAIILAPTREIASQISDVIVQVGSQVEGLNVVVVMGGLPFKEDTEKFKKNVHILVGSPGRMRHLIQDNHINVSSVRLLVLDEADKLMENSYKPDINYIFSCLPKQKQVIMSSATYPDEAMVFIDKYVQKAQRICPESTSILLGIKQKMIIVPQHNNNSKQISLKYEELKKILNGKQFKQCLIFCNYQTRVGDLYRILKKDRWPVEQLYGQQDQTDRLEALKTLQQYKCRILVSTDVAARGIDASNVDIVINFEAPFDWQTYLHRIGRAGRYGSYGTAISILIEGKEKMKFKRIIGRSRMVFDIQNFWDNTSFNLIPTTMDDSRKDVNAPGSVSPKITTLNEDKINLLWEALSTELTEQKDDDTQDMSRFEALSDLNKKSCKSSIESFSELMHSFVEKKNDSNSNLGSIEYKQVKVSKLPTDIHLNCSEIFGAKSKVTNNPADEKEIPERKTELKKEINYFNKDYVNEREPVHNENERYLISEEELLSDNIAMEERNTPLNYKDSITKNKIQNEYIQMGIDNTDLQKSAKNKKQGESRFRKQSTETEVCPTRQALIDAGLPTAFGKPEIKNNYSHKSRRNLYNSNNNHKNKKSYQSEVNHRPINKQHNDKKNIKIDCPSHTDEESVRSDYSNSSKDEQATTKSKNNHSLRNAPSSCTYNIHQNNSKRNNKSWAQDRSKQFDLWYNQFKHQMQYIQYAFYIEELRKL